MRAGDISDEVAPAIGLRFERVIKTEEGKLNRSAKAYLLSIARLDVNIHILTTGDPRRCMAFCLKWGVPYHRVIGCESTLEIPDVCREQDLLTFYDMDKTILQNINSRGYGKIEAKQWTSVEVS